MTASEHSEDPKDGRWAELRSLPEGWRGFLPDDDEERRLTCDSFPYVECLFGTDPFPVKK